MPGSKEAHADQDLDSIEKGPYEAAAGVAGCTADNTPAISAVQSSLMAHKTVVPGAGQQANFAISSGLLESQDPSAEDSAVKEADGTAVLLKAHSAQAGAAAKPVSTSEDDVEKGFSDPDQADEPVDFLGGFSLNSSFDPHMDV